MELRNILKAAAVVILDVTTEALSKISRRLNEPTEPEASENEYAELATPVSLSDKAVQMVEDGRRASEMNFEKNKSVLPKKVILKGSLADRLSRNEAK